MSSTRIAALLACPLLITLWLLPALANPNRCIQSCKQRTADCIRADCAGLRGEVKRSCTRTCRAGSGCGSPRVRTLAYVVTGCRADAGLITGTQALRIQRGNCDPVTVGVCTGGVDAGRVCSQAAECPGGACGKISSGPQPDVLDGCRVFGELRIGFSSYAGGFYPRLAVSPDGSGVVFELTDDHALLAPQLPPGFPLEEGIFFVRADGTGLRRLGPPSRDRPFRFATDTGNPIGLTLFYVSGISFSPDGRSLVMSDLGPGPAGEDAPQIFMLDVASGTRTQLTHLPALRSALSPLQLYAGSATFVDNHTIAFFFSGDLDEMHPNGTHITIRTDGSGLRMLPNPIPVPGSRFDPEFTIAGGGRAVVNARFDRPPAGPHPLPTAFPFVQEVFVIDGKNFLQLTNFDRDDTIARFLGVNRRRAFFVASADPLGTNPSQNCQLFSIDTLGRRLRQLTRFQEGDHAVNGCAGGPPPGCPVGRANQDPVTQTVVFESGCDPLGRNPSGGQLFAMRPNGSGLRQLTHIRGMVTHVDGSIEVELPGPWAYSASRAGVAR